MTIEMFGLYYVEVSIFLWADEAMYDFSVCWQNVLKDL